MTVAHKFNIFVQDSWTKKHDFSVDSIKLLLTDTILNAADTIIDTTTTRCTVKSTSNVLELVAGNGYTKGGVTLVITSAIQTGGAEKVIADDITVSASGGSIGPFRYLVLYNNSQGTTATRPVIVFWDLEQEITILTGNHFLIDFSQVNGVLQLI